MIAIDQKQRNKQQQKSADQSTPKNYNGSSAENIETADIENGSVMSAGCAAVMSVDVP